MYYDVHGSKVAGLSFHSYSNQPETKRVLLYAACASCIDAPGPPHLCCLYERAGHYSPEPDPSIDYHVTQPVHAQWKPTSASAPSVVQCRCDLLLLYCCVVECELTHYRQPEIYYTITISWVYRVLISDSVLLYHLFYCSIFICTVYVVWYTLLESIQ